MPSSDQDRCSRSENHSSSTLDKSNFWDLSEKAERPPPSDRRTFTCSDWKAFAIGLAAALLIAGIALAVILAVWQTSKSKQGTVAVETTTTSVTTQTTSTSSSSTTTSTSSTSTTTSASTTTAGAIIYSQTFTGGVASNAQCTPWTAFVAQLIARPYTLLTMYGTFDPTGVTVTDPTIIANIAAALRTSTSYGPVTTNSRSWVVGACGGGYELSASGTTCQCTTPGYILRPCINHADYGGVNSTTCSGPTQTMTVVFQ